MYILCVNNIYIKQNNKNKNKIYLISVATTSLNINAGMMTLQVENGTQVQVPRSLMQAFLKQDPNQPGLETVRLPNSTFDETITLPNHCREIETDVCLICRRCGRAYPQETTLLSHQRSCYLGNQQRRGALRLVQARYSCNLCDTNTSTRTYGTMNEWRRHAETVQHRARLEFNQQPRQLNHQQYANQFNNSVGVSGVSGVGGGGGVSGNSSVDLNGQIIIEDDANPLIDEMEDVVNQITLLAARAAAESTTTTTITPTTTTINNTGLTQTKQDNNNGPDVKRQKLIQEVAALAGAR